ncbi:MAG: hypothetical protein C0600_11270 [Ignavibacteria bacterium]|nr:MAG: hypothetical protein C0600_11270 [Ignavibacteria bacterium]
MQGGVTVSVPPRLIHGTTSGINGNDPGSNTAAAGISVWPSRDYVARCFFSPRYPLSRQPTPSTPRPNGKIVPRHSL